MSNLGLFIVGTFVTMLVAASMALLFWAAVADGRDEEARRAAEHEATLVRPGIGTVTGIR